MNRVVDRLVVAIRYVVEGAAPALRTSTQIAAAVTAAATATVGFAIAQAAAIDQTAKTARSLGITTEAYTELAYAADRSGVSQELLGTALRSLQMQIGAAAAGSKETAKLFNAMGVSFRDANGNARQAADVLPEIADGLKRLPSDGARSTTQLRLLGEGGARMATLLAGGSVEIDKLRSRARELGISLDSDTGAAAERLTDSMTDLRAVAKGAALTLAGALMPAVADGVDEIVKFAIASDGVVKAGLDRTVRGIALAFDFLRTPAGKATAGVVGLAGAVGTASMASSLVGTLTTASPALGALGKGFLAAAPKAGVMGVALVGLALVIDDIIVTAEGGDSVIRRLADSMGVGEETAYAFAETGNMVATAWGAVPGILAGVAAIAGTLPAALNGIPGPIKEIQEWLVWANPPLRALIAGFQWMLDNLPSLGGVIKGVGDYAKKSGEGWMMFTRYAAGDEGVELSTQRRDIGATNLLTTFAAEGLAGIGTAARAAGRGEDVRAALDASDASLYQRLGAAPAGAPPVSVSVSVQGATRDAARDAGRQVERELMRVADALEQE